jgi:hypothetical protein
MTGDVLLPVVYCLRRSLQQQAALERERPKLERLGLQETDRERETGA